MNLNDMAFDTCQELVARAEFNRVTIHEQAGTRIIDCGIDVPGGLEAGCLLAKCCLAGLGQVSLAPPNSELSSSPTVIVQTDRPIEACLASQYAGWQIALEKYFAMGSGPMRAARGKEPIFSAIRIKEDPTQALGVLETSQLPTQEVCAHLANECRVEPERLTLLVAPTSSIAGSLQVVARSVETALHKLHEIGFDLLSVTSGFGVAPLPPVAADDLVGIGRTNDAIMYGGEVTLWVRTSDELLLQFGPQVPSSASSDYGSPFLQIYERYDRDFYKIDPLLFSPAVVNFVNLTTGRQHRFGRFETETLRQSFDG